MPDVLAVRDHTPAIASVGGQVRYAVRGFVRTPVAAFFTIAFPVLFVVLIGLIAGDAIADPATGLRVTQVAVPGMMAFAIAMAAFTTPAVAMAIAREQGVLKRLRGTPLPAWAYLAGRVIAAMAVAAVAVLLMLVLAVVAFDVQVYASTVPRAVGVLLIASAAFAAMAFAVVALVPSSSTTQMVTTGSVVTLGFVSEIFTVGGELPGWLQAVGDAFPLKHVAVLLREAFLPQQAAFGWDHLAVVLAWGVVGAAVATWRFSWQPRGVRGPAATADVPTPLSAPAPAVATGPLPSTVIDAGPVGAGPLLTGQIRYALLALRRDPGAVFFAVLFPVLFVLLMPAVFGDGELDGYGLPFAQVLGPAMTAYGISIHAFVTLPEQLVKAREIGVLKRLRGTPLPTATFLAGRLVAVLVVAVLIAVLTLGAAAVVWGMDLPAIRLPVAGLVLVLGSACMAALGMVVAGLVRSAKSVVPVTLGLLLPLAFVSDIFSFAPLPTGLQVIGWAFPLKPFVHALLQALDAGSPAFAWGPLAALLAWGVAGALLATRTTRRAAGQPRT